MSSNAAAIVVSVEELEGGRFVLRGDLSRLGNSTVRQRVFDCVVGTVREHSCHGHSDACDSCRHFFVELIAVSRDLVDTLMRSIFQALEWIENIPIRVTA